MIQTPTRYAIDNLLYGCDDIVEPWVLERIKELTAGATFKPCTTIGILRDSKIVGGVIFSHFHPHAEGGDITVSVAFDPGARITKGMWRRLFDYPFGTLGCNRITTFAARSNKTARKLNERAGFRLEGVRRKGLGLADIFMFGMLRNECKFWKAN